MDQTRRQRWAVVLVGIIYAGIGVVFAWPASHVRFWRASAWVLSAVVYATHIGYERFTINSVPRRAALHVSGAVAIGALGLAVSALIHSLSVIANPGHTRLLLIALVAWPVLTGIPAFIV